MTSICAHRGASADAPENTLPAFELALEQDADGFELDVQLSADGELVVCHDETIDRTSDGTGAIAELTLDQLRSHSFNNKMARFGQVPVPTLAEVLTLAKGTGKIVNIELKNTDVSYEGMEAKIEDLVAELDMADQIFYSSFNHLSLVRLAELGTTIGLGALYVEQLVRPWDYAAGFGASALHPMALTVDAAVVTQAHKLGLRVHPWTVDAPEDIKALAEIGVDAIITNRPAFARSVLAGGPADA